MMLIEDIIKKPLYVSRPLLNTKDIYQWAKTVGLRSLIELDELHVTVLYSNAAVDWDKFQEHQNLNELRINDSDRKLMKLGEAFVLKFNSPILTQQHELYLEMGASSNFKGYIPHVTLSYMDHPMNVSPYTGPLVFGPEEFKELNLNWSPAEEIQLASG